MGDTSTKDILKTLESKYLKQDFEGLLGDLLQNKDKFDPGIFHYNLGTIYSKTGNLGAARYHLEKSLSKGFSNQSSLKNLSTVKSQLKTIGAIPEESIKDSFYNFSVGYPSDFFLMISLFLILIFSFVGKKVFEAQKFLKVCLLLLALIPYSLKIYFNNSNYKAAILMKNSIVREGPSGIYDQSYEVSAGVKVVVSKISDGWCFIKSPGILTGWVPRKDLGLL